MEKMKIRATMIVRRSRLRSTTVDPAMEPPSWPPPNMSDRPPPRPECSRIKKISVRARRMTIPVRMAVITAHDATLAAAAAAASSKARVEW